MGLTAMASGSLAAVGEDLQEGAPAQLLERDAGDERLFLRECAAVDAAEEEVEQALAGGGVVEHVAHQRRLRGLADEVLQPLARRGQALEEEAVDGAIAARELGGVQVPALVEAVHQRVARVVRVQAPGGVDRAL